MPQARELLEASHALMESLFPSEANHFLSVEKLAAPHIDFFLAKDSESALGCVALADYREYGEVKSMFVAEKARGRGVAQALLSHLMAVARDRKIPTLRLETGQPGLEAAHRLYERHGFTDCAAFGAYKAGAPYSRYMELSL
ncbi:GNAT family N-acetyltransferase [Sulfitobacter sp. PR48]|nr:GNAT family N-acetyltransferase [Sulfitobacter sp. PR48]